MTSVRPSGGVSKISHTARKTPDAPTQHTASPIAQHALPAGCFVTEVLASDCARFLEEARGRAIARASTAKQDPRFYAP